MACVFVWPPALRAASDGHASVPPSDGSRGTMSKRRRLVAPPPGRTAAALDRSRKSVRPVESIQADSELVALIVQKRRGSATPEPIVFQNAAGDWPARQWTPATFGSGRLGELQTELAFGRRRTAGDKLGVCWETGCDHQIGGLGQFVRWMNGESPTNFERWDPQSHWGYASYKRMHQLFAKTPEVLDEVQWERFGLPVAGAASNFWFGSEGTSTPCHLDSYGSNLIAQLHGRKKWTLFPPEQTDCLYPTRLPYEESSVFSRVDLVDPDTDVHPRFQNAAPYEVVLNPGDVLFVPRHWWHYVEALDTAISVNLWLTHPADPAARVSEALVRLLVSELKREPVVRAPSISPAQTDPSRNLWLNPGEVCLSTSDNLKLLSLAVQQLDSVAASTSQYTLDRVIRALVDPFTVKAIQAALLCGGEQSSEVS